MPLLLRVDVDKPYGNTTFFNAVRSKLSEDFWFPNFPPFNKGYLKQLEQLIRHCNQENIVGSFFFRICTLPDNNIVRLMKEGKQIAGVHAENTRNIESFKNEWNIMVQRCPIELHSFSKHGSGDIKLGKYHYAPYEPEKYRAWANELGIEYKTGNDICSSSEDFIGAKDFYEKIFWIEREYRNTEFSQLDQVIEVAKNNVVPILIHPSNYDSTKEVREDFTRLIELANKNNITWIS